jgi:hypothetical protein
MPQRAFKPTSTSAPGVSLTGEVRVHGHRFEELESIGKSARSWPVRSVPPLTCDMADAMTTVSLVSLKKPLRDNDDIARNQRDIALDVAISDQAIDVERIGLLRVAYRSHQRCSVACGESG